jgi:serine/threonine-protein kinase
VFLVGDFSKGTPERLYAKLLDFGLSRFHATEEEKNLTKTGFIMGTPSYMAPEQARGKRVDHRADVYGVGTILYTALTGRAPFDEDSPQATILAVMNSEPPRPRSITPAIPPHVELVIERAMAKNPDDRYPDMAAFEQALEALPAAAASAETGAPAAAAAVPSVRRAQHVSEADGDVHAARPRLVLYLFAAVLLLISSATVAISGVELASGYSFDRVELRLILLSIVGSSLTPAILWFLHIRRKIWDNSSRVLALLGQVRAAVLAGIASYGLFLLAFNVLDGFLVRFLARPDVKPVGVTWAGWNLLLPAIALTTAVAVGWRRRLASGTLPGWQRLLAVWTVAGLALAIVAGFVYFGLIWRAGGIGG